MGAQTQLGGALIGAGMLASTMNTYFIYEETDNPFYAGAGLFGGLIIMALGLGVTISARRSNMDLIHQDIELGNVEADIVEDNNGAIAPPNSPIVEMQQDFMVEEELNQLVLIDDNETLIRAQLRGISEYRGVLQRQYSAIANNYETLDMQSSMIRENIDTINRQRNTIERSRQSNLDNIRLENLAREIAHNNAQVASGNARLHRLSREVAHNNRVLERVIVQIEVAPEPHLEPTVVYQTGLPQNNTNRARAQNFQRWPTVAEMASAPPSAPELPITEVVSPTSATSFASLPPSYRSNSRDSIIAEIAEIMSNPPTVISDTRVERYGGTRIGTPNSRSE